MVLRQPFQGETVEVWTILATRKLPADPEAATTTTIGKFNYYLKYNIWETSVILSILKSLITFFKFKKISMKKKYLSK